MNSLFVALIFILIASCSTTESLKLHRIFTKDNMSLKIKNSKKNSNGSYCGKMTQGISENSLNKAIRQTYINSGFTNPIGLENVLIEETITHYFIFRKTCYKISGTVLTEE